jgi:hypothetical protein
MNFDPIGTPTKIAFEGDDLAIVAAVWPVAFVLAKSRP